jgi:hypothetical protein
MPDACQRCGVRADVGCKHQKPTGQAPPASPQEKVRGPNLNSRFGKAGNPTKREFNAMLPPGWRK